MTDVLDSSLSLPFAGGLLVKQNVGEPRTVVRCVNFGCPLVVRWLSVDCLQSLSPFSLANRPSMKRERKKSVYIVLFYTERLLPNELFFRFLCSSAGRDRH